MACTIKGFCPFRVLLFLGTIALFAIAAALNARAADAGRGQRLARSIARPATPSAPHMRGEVVDAPPFEAIGRKYGHDAGKIAAAIAGPHPNEFLAAAGAGGGRGGLYCRAGAVGTAAGK